jgi:hypothetical protein
MGRVARRVNRHAGAAFLSGALSGWAAVVETYLLRWIDRRAAAKGARSDFIHHLKQRKIYHENQCIMTAALTLP